MELLYPSKDAAPFGLRAMATIARAGANGLSDVHRALLNAAQKVILKTELNLDQLSPIEPAELAANFTDHALAEQLIRGMVVMSLAEGSSTTAQVDQINGFSKALGVDEPAVKVIYDLAEENILMFRLDFYRRSHIKDYIANQYKGHGGFLGVVKGILGFKGLVEDKELSERFYSLDKLPEDSFGKCIFKHYKENGFLFPGEKGGFPMGAVFHDCGHIIGGYDTSPEGELQAAAFQSGYRKNKDAFFTFLFAVLIHTSGVNVAPMEMPKLLGRIGQEGLAEEILKAMERGNAMNTDLGDNWDFWPLTHLPLKEVRNRLGVPAINN